MVKHLQMTSSNNLTCTGRGKLWPHAHLTLTFKKATICNVYATLGKCLIQAVPSVYALQSLTDKVNNFWDSKLFWLVRCQARVYNQAHPTLTWKENIPRGRVSNRHQTRVKYLINTSRCQFPQESTSIFYSRKIRLNCEIRYC